jgi:hypothetical protein
MIRSVTYRRAFNAFLFTGLWFVLGAIMLWSPIPGALGIGGAMFGAWVLLFFASLAIAGLMLTFAALNGAFPGRPEHQRPKAAVASQQAGGPAWAPRADAPRAAQHARREG